MKEEQIVGIDGRITVSVGVGEDAKVQTDYIAVAFSGPEVTVINFYEVLMDMDSSEFVDTILREVRFWPTPKDAPECMPIEELDERLDAWIENEAAGFSGHYGFSESVLSGVPFHRMWQRAGTDYLHSEQEEKLLMPSSQQISAAMSSPDFLGYRNARELAAALEQLQTVALYADAIRRGLEKPVHYVADQFGDTSQKGITRVRNLIQFARTRGLLTKSQAGRAGGAPTRNAILLANQVRAFAGLQGSRKSK